MINFLRSINGYAPLKYDFEASHPIFGFQGDINIQYKANNEFGAGYSYFYNEDGIPMFAFGYVEDIIHALWFELAEKVWDYMSHFSRDAQTLKVIYTP